MSDDRDAWKKKCEELIATRQGTEGELQRITREHEALKRAHQVAIKNMKTAQEQVNEFLLNPLMPPHSTARSQMS